MMYVYLLLIDYSCECYVMITCRYKWGLWGPEEAGISVKLFYPITSTIHHLNWDMLGWWCNFNLSHYGLFLLAIMLLMWFCCNMNLYILISVFLLLEAYVKSHRTKFSFVFSFIWNIYRWTVASSRILFSHSCDTHITDLLLFRGGINIQSLLFPQLPGSASCLLPMNTKSE